MITRKEHMAGERGFKNHRVYFAQFVDDNIKSNVLRIATVEQLKEAVKKDKYFNSIPLRKWDSITFCNTTTAKKLREAGDCPTKAGMTCIYKEAAFQLTER